jgi:hypothetical protein
MTGKTVISISLLITFLFTISCKKVDNTAPGIELIGPDLVYHVLNEKYIDQGVTVIEESNDIVEAVPNSNVNEDKTGTYTVIWTAVDKAGNSSSVSRTVIVYNVADTLDGKYSGECIKPYPGGDVFPINSDSVFADSLINNKIWFSKFAAYDSCFVYLILSDSSNYIPEQKTTIMTDSLVDVTFQGTCTLGMNSFEIDFTEEMLNDSIICNTSLQKK